MKYLAILGRQSKISLAELESLYRDTKQIAPSLAIFESNKIPDINRLGGTLKIAKFLDIEPIAMLQNLPEGKITLGVSDYSKRTFARLAQGEALKMKKILTRHGRSVRVLTNKSAVLSTATSHHNQLGEKPNHIELIKVERDWYQVIGIQNITAYAKRDYARPARDARVGMLPPKLAQILINLCGDLPKDSRLLDPFCGTGVVLQEAALMGYDPYGSDIDPRMIEYTKKNLKWLTSRGDAAVGDATSFVWPFSIDLVACETLLGRPMSTPPAEIKLKEEKQTCSSIILGFLKNIAPQLKSGAPLTLAIPAWLRPDGTYSRLNILDEIETLGYNVKKFINVSQEDLLYYRESQIVAREIIVLRKA